jgi:undecaprenyl-diphosphatase
VRRYSRLGEHGLLWYGVGAAGALMDTGRRRRWVKATAVVGGSYLISTSIKMAIGRKRPVVEDLPHLMATPTGLSFPSSHSSSSFAGARGLREAAAGGPALPGGLRDGLLAALPGRALPLGHRRRAALGSVLGTLGRR